MFQQYSPALKQFCLAYLSPWLPNLSLSLFEATATEHEKASVCMHFENVYAHIEYLYETGIVGTCMQYCYVHTYIHVHEQSHVYEHFSDIERKKGVYMYMHMYTYSMTTLFPLSCVLQLIRLIDMLVALTISEDTIYPLIQSCVWAKIGGEPRLLKRVLDSFIRVSGEGRREKGGGG